ncbi:MAG: hypothetical protein A3J24_01525 [Deltaproteobacteria bacterium RIFCSPLOWO2_02_FULL_53_8]|nr:MAG: hypothetical protein A3J24_01525 [Deltaproteobacteria bacterium RIFCSPLOWO2_02_FULL_53_8]
MKTPIVPCPDLDQARRHLTLLDEDAASFVFQTFDDSKRNDPSLARVLYGTLDEYAAELTDLNQKGAGVFFLVNISKNGRRKAVDITHARAVFREADAPDLPQLPLSPHFIIQTSPGKRHEYLLIEPTEDFDTWDRIMSQMVATYGSDPNAKDRARVLRLAGFYHLKNPLKPHLVRIISEDGGLPYPLEHIARHIPPAEKNRMPAPPVGGTIMEGERNSRFTSLAGSMRRRNMSEGAILAALREENRRCCPPLEDREVEQIARSVAKYEPEPLPVPGLIQRSLEKISIENIRDAELQAPTYAVTQLVPEREVTLLGGHGGAGKSILALAQGAHYAAGASWSGFDVRGGRVTYISLEDPGPLIIYRLKKVCEAYDLPLSSVIENLTILDGSEADGALCVETNEYGVRSVVMTPLFEEVKAAVKGCGLIIIDNASDAYGADENSRRQVRRFIRELRSLARENNAGLLLLAHIDKTAARYGANGNTYSGSTAWHNSVRSRLALTEKDGCVEFVQEKLNVGKRLDRAVSLTWHEGVLMPAGGTFEAMETERQEDMDKAAVLAAIQKAIDDGESVPTARTGPKTTQNVLERYPDLPGHLRGRNGRELFYGALTALHREGQLTTEEYTTAARNVRQRFCVGCAAHTYTPYTPCVELTKPTQADSSVAGVASVTGTDETNETDAGEILEVLE